ncbi:MAG TPA: hypothetical protein DCP02_07385 [Actinobacteria bacterium]|nr:hypothetical protein [Actinomycetota bacterium]
MSYPYLFISPDQAGDDIIKITDRDELKHLFGPLRGKPGDTVYFSDNNSLKYTTTIKEINKKEAFFEINRKQSIERSIPGIALLQCILKKNAMELAIQKTTEIGISRIIPIISERTISDIAGSSSKLERWQKISDEASKQCKRDFKCLIDTPIKINNIIEDPYDHFFFLHEANNSGRANMESIFRALYEAKNIAYLIGPEGGLTTDETIILKNKKAETVNLGKNILRAETAAVYFLSVIDFYIKLNR